MLKAVVAAGVVGGAGYWALQGEVQPKSQDAASKGQNIMQLSIYESAEQMPEFPQRATVGTKIREYNSYALQRMQEIKDTSIAHTKAMFPPEYEDQIPVILIGLVSLPAILILLMRRRSRVAKKLATGGKTKSVGESEYVKFDK